MIIQQVKNVTFILSELDEYTSTINLGEFHLGIASPGESVMNWNELFRVCRKQIVWQPNRFCENLKPGSFFIWEKGVSLELAWVSWDKKPMLIRKPSSSSEKPVYLYRWLFLNYVERDQRVLDTHGCSPNIAIAAAEFRIQLTIVNKEEKDHYLAIEKFKKSIEVNKLDLF